MSAWTTALADLTADSPGEARPRAVLVSVAGIRGSAPREPGAKMVVGESRLAGTIGGGQLELKAIEIARALLAEGSPRATHRRFPVPTAGTAAELHP